MRVNKTYTKTGDTRVMYSTPVKVFKAITAIPVQSVISPKYLGCLDLAHKPV